LSRLDVSHSDVTDEGIKAVAGACPLLAKLYLSNTKITDEGVKAVAAACPSLTIL